MSISSKRLGLAFVLAALCLTGEMVAFIFALIAFQHVFDLTYTIPP